MTTAMPATAMSIQQPDEEALYGVAERLAFFELTELVGWVLTDRRASALVDETIAELGVPEPDYDADGEPVAGSVLRKLLRYAHVEAMYRALTHGESL